MSKIERESSAQHIQTVNLPNIGRQINNKQVVAIKMSEIRGRQLATEHPEIAGQYQGGRTKRQLAREYRDEIASDYPGLSFASVVSAMRVALEYLIDPDKREELGKEHKKEAGEKARDNSMGFFGMTDEARNEFRRRGARTLMQNKTGIFGFDPEKKRGIGIDIAIKQGKTPTDDAEREYTLQLCKDSTFQHQAGASKGKPNYNLITAEMNRKFGTDRTEMAFKIIKSLAQRKLSGQEGK